MKESGLLPSTTAEGPKIHIRPTKGVGDYHDADGGAALLFGETEAMIKEAKRMTCDLNALTEDDGALKVPPTTGKACGMIAIPLTSIMRQLTEDIIATIRVAMESQLDYDIVSKLQLDKNPNGNIKLQYHFMKNLIDGLQDGAEWWMENEYENVLPSHDKAFVPWLPSRMHIDPSQISVILAVWNWEHCCEVGIVSGKRFLGETPLDCCLREVIDKTAIDLTSVPRRGKDQNSVATRTFPTHQDWMLTLHLQLHSSCYVYSHKSMFL